MHIYLASRFSRIDELNRYRKLLEKDGHVITSRWLLEPKTAEGDDYAINVRRKKEADKWESIATVDVDDVYDADLVLSFTEAPRTGPTRGGRHVEFGMGVAWNKLLMIVGPVENVFHALPQVRRFTTFTAARAAINANEEAWVKSLGLNIPVGIFSQYGY